MISYDEDKPLSNIEKHGIDFIGCETIFDQPMLTQEDNRYDYGEQRLQSFGIFNNQVVCLVWVDREVPHIISIRQADKYETKQFIKTLFG